MTPPEKYVVFKTADYDKFVKPFVGEGLAKESDRLIAAAQAEEHQLLNSFVLRPHDMFSSETIEFYSALIAKSVEFARWVRGQNLSGFHEMALLERYEKQSEIVAALAEQARGLASHKAPD